MNSAKVDAFARRLFTELLATMSALNIYLGHRLGLFRAMADGSMVTPSELAARTGYADRYVREWLECMAVCEYVDYDPVTDRFSLPAEHAVALLDHDHPKYAAAFFCFVPSFARILPILMDAFRSGGGVPYEAYGEDAREAIGMGNRPMFVNDYVTRWIPAMPDIERRLRAGGRVAELGCGVGWSSISLARGFPDVRIDAVDADAASVQQAHHNIQAGGVADRITLHRAAAEDAPLSGPYDLVTALECLHDMAYPVQALRRMRELASPDGAVLVAGEAVGESLGENRNFLGRLSYNISLLYSLPQAMVHPGSAGIGTMLGPSTLRRYAEEAGFSRVEILAVESRHWRLYRLTP
jgi:2-polyprenyl-3-methyl-5-hydroxy-6-metoxy-1,4-benzoquinol methylase